MPLTAARSETIPRIVKYCLTISLLLTVSSAYAADPCSAERLFDPAILASKLTGVATEGGRVTWRIPASGKLLLILPQINDDLVLEIATPAGVSRANHPGGTALPELWVGAAAAGATFSARAISQTADASPLPVWPGCAYYLSDSIEGGDAFSTGAELAHRASEVDDGEVAEIWTRARKAFAEAVATAEDDGVLRSASMFLELRVCTKLRQWRCVVELAQRLRASRVDSALSNRLFARALAEEVDAQAELGNLDRQRVLLDEITTHGGRLKDPAESARLLNAAGMAAYRMSDLERATIAFVDAAEASVAAGDHQSATRSYSNAAKVAERRGRFDEAFDSYELGLQSAQQASLFAQAMVLENYGGALALVGRLAEALEHYHQAENLFNETNDVPSRARALEGIGQTYLRLGRFKRASRYFDRSLLLDPELAERGAAIDLYLSMSAAHRATGELPEALADVAAGMQRAVTRSDKAHLLLERSRIEQQSKDVDAARLSASTALEHLKGSGERYALADAHILLAELLAEANPVRAAEEIARAYRHLDRSGLSEIEVRARIVSARVALAQGEVTEAVAQAQEAARSIDLLARRLGSPELAAHRTAFDSPSHELVVTLLMDAAAAADSADERRTLVYAALDASEFSKGSTYRQMVHRSALRALPPAVRAQREVISQALAAQLRHATDADGAQGRVADLLLDLELLDESLAVSVGPEGLLTEIDARAWALRSLKQGEFALQYFIGDTQGFAWLLSADGIQSWRIAGAAEIETLVSDFLGVLNGERRHSPAVDELGEMLLSRLRGVSVGRLLVVPDGPLNDLPFAALPFESGRYLVEAIDLHTTPSLAVSQLLEERTYTPNKDRVLAIADPIYSSEDVRYDGRHGVFQGLPRLFHTVREARALESANPDGDTELMQGAEATREAVLRRSLADYGLLHISTHAVVNTEYPELSSLQLSRVDARGDISSGVLHVNDLRYKNVAAELITLSACESASGRSLRGGGVIGLASAFMNAGAAALLASHLTVDDRATADFFSAFYSRYLFEGMGLVRSLAETQREFIVSPRWRSRPWSWAGWSIVGHDAARTGALAALE